MENLKEREKKGDALSTIILLVMKADDKEQQKLMVLSYIFFILSFLRII